MMSAQGDGGPTAEAFAQRLFTAGLGAFETLSVYVGDRLGWYRALAADGPSTAAELAATTGCDERYCREWLEMQASFGTLTVEGAVDPAMRRYTLPRGPAEVLTDETSLSFLAPLARMIGAVGPQLPDLLTAYRSGGGVSWDQFGDDARFAQSDMNRPWFETRLGPALAGVEHLSAVLAAPGAVIADVACGTGWSSIALARAFPEASVVGYDTDEPSIDAARAMTAGAGLEDRIVFRSASGDTLAADAYDAAFVFEALHDMPDPVAVLAAIRRAVRPGGVVVVMDEAVADELTAPADDVDKIMYGYSVFICLPDGMSSRPSVATGTVMRRSILESYARQAGFRTVSVLPIEDFAFFRFYQLHG
jgi:SAM-dependent methyltransferase